MHLCWCVQRWICAITEIISKYLNFFYPSAVVAQFYIFHYLAEVVDTDGTKSWRYCKRQTTTPIQVKWRTKNRKFSIRKFNQLWIWARRVGECGW
jgi:hypothetical protein